LNSAVPVSLVDELAVRLPEQQEAESIRTDPGADQLFRELFLVTGIACCHCLCHPVMKQPWMQDNATKGRHTQCGACKEIPGAGFHR